MSYAKASLAFAAFVLTYWLVCIPVIVANVIFIFVLGGKWEVTSSSIFMAFGGVGGVWAGTIVLNMYFRPYPARIFAILFIAATGFVFALELVGLIGQILEKQTDWAHPIAKETARLAGGVAAMATCWWALWNRRGYV
ncbi:MAG TPA: hypothetical protein VL358_14055 [Caulobacteraceae bacterium]|nr:hypothetical protein [Caulobacteraceae bacterium]